MTSENLGWLRITLLMDSLGLKILLLKDRETEWWTKSSVEISTDISHLETKNSRESDTIKKSTVDLTCCFVRSSAGRRIHTCPDEGHGRDRRVGRSRRHRPVHEI